MRKIKNTHQIILPLTTTYTHLYFKKWAIFTTQIILDTHHFKLRFLVVFWIVCNKYCPLC